MRSRTHASFRREATFHAAPRELAATVLADDEVAVRREDVAPGVYLLHGLMTRRECRQLIAARTSGSSPAAHLSK